MATVVFFHAHPDDEALLTGGTMAVLAAQRHRVVLVTATDGSRGLTDMSHRGGRPLERLRSAELQRAARHLGCHRLVELGYRDSGMTGATEPGSFVEIPLDEPVHALGRVLGEESATALFTYDAVGGYGHRDHVRAYQVAQLAADAVQVPVVYQATVDRQLLIRAAHVAHWLKPHDPQLKPDRFSAAFTETRHITHRVRTGRYAEVKRRALRAHTSQLSGGGDTRTLMWMTRLPGPVFRAVLGTEWFVMQRADAGADDVLSRYRIPSRNPQPS